MRALLFLNPPHTPVNEKKMSDQRREEEDGAPVYTLCCMSVVTLTHTHTHIFCFTPVRYLDHPTAKCHKDSLLFSHSGEIFFFFSSRSGDPSDPVECGVFQEPLSPLSMLLLPHLSPQRSVRTMAGCISSTTTHGRRSGMILGPKGETASWKISLCACMCWPAC